jgi:hypothetical protein
VPDYGLDDWGSIPDRDRGFFSNPCIQTGSGAHPASYPMGTGGPFPGGKAQPGRDADHSPPSSKTVSLHVMEAHRGRGGIAPTHT